MFWNFAQCFTNITNGRTRGSTADTHTPLSHFASIESGSWDTHTHTHNRLTALFSGTTQVGRYQKGKPNLDFTEAGDSEWQCHQLGCMQVCTSLQTDNHASTPPLSFLQAECPSCCPTNSVKALKETWDTLLLSNRGPFGLLQVAYA